MKPRRRRSDAALPRSPLDFAYPLAVRGPGAEGAAVLDELPPRHALLALKALRLVLAWARGPDLALALLRREEMEAWEEEVLSGHSATELWAPVGALAGELARPERADPARVAAACIALADWAIGEGAVETALLFAQAAALAWPQNPRYAWIAGRMLRNHGHFREAELWLKRAARVAVWCDDAEVQFLALNSLGNLQAQQGAFAEAVHFLTRALRIARRHKLKQREGEVTHDLFAVSVYTGEYARAERLAISAFALYGPEHSHLPKLAHDVAYLWNEQGRFGIALPVLRALLPFFRVSEERLLVLAATARAAGACGDHGVFQDVSREAWEIIRDPTPNASAVLPSIMLYIGFGAASLGQWGEAGEALTLALNAALERGAHDDAAKAEAALEMVRRHERIEHATRTSAGSPAAQLAEAFVRSLEETSLEGRDLDEPVCGRAT